MIINDDELANLPLNAEAAFIKLVEILDERLKAVEASKYRRVASDYVTVMKAFIDEHGMPIEFRTTPPTNSSVWPDWFEDFHDNIQYHYSRYRFRHRIAPADAQVATLELNDEYRAEIHQLLNKIRKVVANLNIDDQKRDAIYEKIAALAKEVDKSKTGLGAFMALFLEACGTLGQGAERLEPLVKLIERVANVFARAKASSEQPALPPPEARRETKRIPGPSASTSPPQSLDDEMPF